MRIGQRRRAHSLFGSFVGDAGDVDKDGTPDLVLGDPSVSERVLARFWVASGKTGATLRSVTLPNDAPLPPTGRVVFVRVHGSANFDGDSTPDMLVSTQPYPRDMEGAVFLVSGKTAEIPLRRVPMRGSFGTDWAQLVGDFDHDEITDFGTLEFDAVYDRPSSCSFIRELPERFSGVVR